MLCMLKHLLLSSALVLALVAPCTGNAAGLRLAIQGTDCELCVHLAKSSIGQLAGVASVWIAPDKSQLLVTLKPGATVDPEAVLLLTRRSGYAVKRLESTGD